MERTDTPTRPVSREIARDVRVSAIVCAHREGDWVRSTVASLLSRRGEVRHLEVLVGDDASPDGCCEGMPEGVRVLRYEGHIGRGSVANAVANEAHGDVLIFPDAHMEVPEGALAEVAATAAQHQAVVCAGVQGVEKSKGSQGFGAYYRFHRRGRLGVRFHHPRGGPKPGMAMEVEQPFGGFYGFARDVFDRLGGWTDVAAIWGYCEQPIGYMAWALGIPVLAVPVVVKHLFRKANPAGANEECIWRNVAYSHYVMFQPGTMETYWRPICEANLGAEKLAEVLALPGIEERRRAFQLGRKAGKVDAEFFRRFLRVEPKADKTGQVHSVPNASIVLPAYNEGGEPVMTMRSFMRSTTSDPEIIFVDDASTDGSCARLNEQGRERFPKHVRIVRNPERLGVCRSRLIGVGLAKEDPLGFADAHSRCNPGDIDRLRDAALQTGGFVVATMAGMGGDLSHPNYGSRFCVKARWGLRGAYNRERPAKPLSRCNMAMGSCYFVRRDVLARLNGWPALPGKWAYSEQAMALKCYHLDVPIYLHRDVLIQHKMKHGTIDVPAMDVLLNAHFVHRAYFDEDTYADIWRPILLEGGNAPEIDELLASELLKAEIAWFKANRRHTDEDFFRHVLGAKPEDLLKIDEKNGRAEPTTQAAYIAYEARRSPGREWTADRGRMERHIRDLCAALDGVARPDVDLLDLGSRDGWILEKLESMGFSRDRMEGLELVPFSARHARSMGRRVVTGDAHNLSPWSEGSKSVVTCIHCLEHLHTPSRALAEMRRVLRKGGLLMIVVPIEPAGLSIKGDHCYSMRNAEAVAELVAAAGFGVGKATMARNELTLFARKP